MDYINITMEELNNIKENNNVIIIDVRSPLEYEENKLEKSINIPLYELKSVESKVKDKNATIIVYCSSGQRSKKAAERLKTMGYNEVYNLIDGINN